MGMTSIEQIIDDIIDFIEGCKTQALSPSKVVVPKDRLYELLDELKLRTPDEIKRYQKIIANRDAIIEDAAKRAEEIKEAARKQASEIVSENSIMRQAYQEANDLITNANAQADEIMQNANHDAEEIRYGALTYSNDMLLNVENTLGDAYETTRGKMEALIYTLRDNLETVTKNRFELNEQIPSRNTNRTRYDANYDSDYDEMEDEYDFPEGKFLEDID